ncbi:Actin-related protein 5 [Hibiscus syriacus]|uniref:Actin-related protein 5 n=1 Tax=Hibiscus syriacus TaxID=106335 RepID=A0A6A2X6M1_HIBSY|nr:Actin-related protein 5 [Hibiscus syriacus]
MPFISKIQRQTDYNRFPSSTPVVIDNGASYFRIGWAGETEPRVVFRNIVQRPRRKSTGETVTIVGDHDTALLRYFDCSRAGPRSADRSSYLDHGMSATRFIPAISAFGVDAVFSYKYNQLHGLCEKDGLAICPGFTTTHVIPFVNGEPVYKGCCQTNIGGFYVTDYLKQLLSLKYPHHMARFTWEKKGGKEAEDKTRCWQLPWVPPPIEEPPSEEEIARKAAIRERQGQRLREMAEAKRSSRINELENQLHGLEFLLQQLGQIQEEEIPFFLSETGYTSKQEIESTLTKVIQSLRKAKGEPKPEQAENEEKTESSMSEKYPLVNVPDNMLTPEQLKENKRQIFLKTTTEGRQLAKQKRFEEELERERKTQLDEERRLENPQLYLEEMHSKYKELREKVEQRKKLETNGGDTNGSSVSGGVGRGERLNAAQRERMRLLTTAAFDRGHGEDTFGARDEDWQLYKLMGKDNVDDENGADEDEAELACACSRLQEIDPTFVPKPEPTPSQPATAEAPVVRALTKEDFQIVLGIERFLCREILFHPNLVGIDQAGLDEMTRVSIRRLPSKAEALENRLTSSIFMTGGCSLFPGINELLEAGVRMLQPCGSPIKVVRALDPVLDAWRGASIYAAN